MAGMGEALPVVSRFKNGGDGTGGGNTGLGVPEYFLIWTSPYHIIV